MQAAVRVLKANFRAKWVLGAIVLWNVVVVFHAASQSARGSTASAGATGSSRPSSRYRHTQRDSGQAPDIYDWLKAEEPARAANAAPRARGRSSSSSTATSGGGVVTAASTAVLEESVAQVVRKLNTLSDSLESSKAGVEGKLTSINDHLTKIDVAIALQRTSRAAATTGASTSGTDKQGLFLPIGPNDFERFANLYRSLVKFLDFDGVGKWLIVTPKRDSDVVSRIERLTAQHKDIIEIKEDAEVVPMLAKLPTTNWMTQQILKLGAADFFDTRFYLVLDADLILFKPTRMSDLVVNNRALTNVYDSMTASTRAEWWESAQKVLDMQIDSGFYFGVTPAFLATDVVKEMRKRLAEVHGKDWAQFLLENVFNFTFTEYTMYGVFAEASGMFAEFHTPAPNALYNHDRSVWFDSQFESLDLQHLVVHGALIPGHFVVLQSNTNIPAERVREKMGKLFD